jgi:hypothetical protein
MSILIVVLFEAMLDARYLTAPEIVPDEFTYTGNRRTPRWISAVDVIIYSLRISNPKVYRMYFGAVK